MAEREPQFVTMSRQGILAVTVMGVGLLTLCYVIGVQVGKRGLAQGGARAKTLDEELDELPEPLDEQLSLFRSMEGGNAPQRSERPRQELAPANRQEQSPVAAPQRPAAAPDAPKAPVGADRYTAQVIATASPDTAKRVSDQLKAAGMPAKVVRADGLYKVQLDWQLPRAELDSRLPRLRALGFSPAAVKLQ
jgi:cell division septation protein DedD